MINLLVLYSLLVMNVSCIKTRDMVKVTGYEELYSLKNETYTFRLIPSGVEVPRTVFKYQTFTTSGEAIREGMKRYLGLKRSLFPISEYERGILLKFMGEGVERFGRKRELGGKVLPSGRRIITLAEDVHLTFTEEVDRKRGIPFGTQFCLHIPGITHCDNTPAIYEMRSTLNAQIDQARNESDNVRKVTNERWDELEEILTNQNLLIGSLPLGSNSDQIETLRQVTQSTTYQMASSDNILLNQMKYLDIVLNGLIEYSNAIGSTDTRSVVAQPSLIELFDAYTRALEVLENGKIPYFPIISKKRFNFKSQFLPNGVKNVETPTSVVFTGTGYIGIHVAFIGFHYFGFYRLNHPIIRTDGETIGHNPGSHTASNFGIEASCYNLYGFYVLGDASTGLTDWSNAPTEVHISNCNFLMMRESNGASISLLSAVINGLFIPFYSSCSYGVLLSEFPQIPISTYSYKETIRLSDRDVYERHYISKDCYININPKWLGLNYHTPSNYSRTIYDIPFGYKTNQFTINPYGELSSSIEFHYTTEWLRVYSLQRESSNNLIVTEITDLEDDQVLFHLTNNLVIDTSDSFLGEGVNGRDCIVRSDDYDDWIMNCNYQNDQKAFSTNAYMTGLIGTTGIARSVNKFDYKFDFDVSNGTYLVHMSPKEDVEFDFFVEFSGNVCPKVISRKSTTTGCDFTLYYTGSETVQMGEVDVTFVGTTTTQSVEYGEFAISVNFQDCLIATCTNTVNISSVVLTAPSFKVISPDELNYISTEPLIRVITDQIELLSHLKEEIQVQRNQFDLIRQALSELDFNFTGKYEYEEFIAVRIAVDSLRSQMNNLAISTNDDDCEGMFSSIICFLEDAVSTVIVMTIVVIAVVIGCFVLNSDCESTVLRCTKIDSMCETIALEMDSSDSESGDVDSGSSA